MPGSQTYPRGHGVAIWTNHNLPRSPPDGFPCNDSREPGSIEASKRGRGNRQRLCPEFPAPNAWLPSTERQKNAECSHGSEKLRITSDGCDGCHYRQPLCQLHVSLSGRTVECDGPAKLVSGHHARSRPCAKAHGRGQWIRPMDKGCSGNCLILKVSCRTHFAPWPAKASSMHTFKHFQTGTVPLMLMRCRSRVASSP